MKKIIFAAVAVLSMASVSFADTVTITAVDIRGTGVFGHDADPMDPAAPFIDATTFNGGAFPGSGRAAFDPIDVQMTQNNVDIDNDGTANDSFTFTMRWTSVGASTLQSFGQGFDTGFGNLNDIQVSLLPGSVIGTATDSGDAIVFDGFTGAAAGAGASGAVDRTVEINGTTVALTTPGAGGFEFTTVGIDFAPTATVLFDNSGGTLGSVVARNYDLQFSTVPAAVPEPSSLALFGLLGGFVALRRRK